MVKGLFETLLAEYLCAEGTMDTDDGIYVKEVAPWKMRCFMAGVRHKDGTSKTVTVYVKPDRDKVWLFSLTPLADEKNEDNEEEPAEDYESWYERRKEQLFYLLQNAQENGGSYTIDARIFPNTEVRDRYFENMIQSGVYAFCEVNSEGGIDALLMND